MAVLTEFLSDVKSINSHAPTAVLNQKVGIIKELYLPFLFIYFLSMLISRVLYSLSQQGQVDPAHGLIYLSLRSYCSTAIKKGEGRREHF